MARYLVTGGAGFVGSHAVLALLDRGDEVVVLDDLSQGHRAAVPAAANDDGIISRFWCSIGPLFGPILMSAKRFGEKTEGTVVGHDIFSSAAIARST